MGADKLREQLKMEKIIAPETKHGGASLEFQLRGKDRTTQFDDVVRDVPKACPFETYSN